MALDVDELKRQAAEKAVESVESGMVVGLGGGSTAAFAVRRIGELIASGTLKDIAGVACGSEVERLAREVGIPLTTLEEHPVVDLTIDGADEVTAELDMIKGGGGALLWEKVVAEASRRELIAVDEGKVTKALGTRWPVPVEVIPFGWRVQAARLESLGARVTLRKGGDGSPYRTDEGNLILDCDFGPIADVRKLAGEIKSRAGVVEHGLFIGLATEVIVAGAEGLRVLRRKEPRG